MSTRALPLDPNLPSTLEPVLKRRLDEILKAYAKRINYATSLEVTNVVSTVTLAHGLALCSTGASTLVVRLASAVRLEDRTMRIKKVDSGAGKVFIVPFGSETVDGATTTTIASQWICLQIVSNGANWFIV